LLEQGLVGLILFMATAVLILITAVSVIRRVKRRGNDDPWILITMVGLLSALIARAVEQGAGVGRVSDLVTFWALMGLVIAIAEIDFGSTVRSRSRVSATILASRIRGLVPLVIVIAAGVLALVVFVQQDVKPLRAGVIAANGFEQNRNGDGNAAFRSFRDAVSLAPNVERYRTELADLLSRTGRTLLEENPDRSHELFQEARNVLLDYERRDPFAWQTQLGIASATANLIYLGDEELTPELISRYLNIANMMSPFPNIQAFAAENIVLAGDWELAAEIAQRAIALEGTTGPLSSAWWTLGQALFQLDQIDAAELAWETSIKRHSRNIYAARSQRGLAFVAEVRGDDEKAAYHHELADGLELALGLLQ
jgi:tetratricopeptide (TPR) repeat protein